MPHEVNGHRPEATGGVFARFAAWIERRMYLAEMRDVDRYLSQSTNLADLENRIRDVERRGSASRWF